MANKIGPSWNIFLIVSVGLVPEYRLLATLFHFPFITNSAQKNAVSSTGNGACELACETVCEILERPHWRDQLNKVAGIFSWHQREWPQG